MPVIGIDLGTSNSAAAVLRGGRPVIMPSSEGLSIGGKAFPSYVARTADGKVLLGEPVEKAVLTVPAYVDDNQRAATKDACCIAGLDVIRLVNEPTAAALAYGLDRLAEGLRIAVIDLGGGTLDVTIMAFGKGVFEVKATSGDSQLGGIDMNRSIFEHLAECFQMAMGVDVRQDSKAAARLMEAAEAAKIDLTASIGTHVSLPHLAAVQGEPRHLELALNRTELERLVRPVIDRCRGPVDQALKDAGIQPNEVDRVVFVGGPSRMPAVRAYFDEIFGHKAEMGVDPMECVAAGAVGPKGTALC